jgi:hypothetical protein
MPGKMIRLPGAVAFSEFVVRASTPELPPVEPIQG